MQRHGKGYAGAGLHTSVSGARSPSRCHVAVPQGPKSMLSVVEVTISRPVMHVTIESSCTEFIITLLIINSYRIYRNNIKVDIMAIIGS